jgi:DNA-binding MarR family transcriptional regulator
MIAHQFGRIPTWIVTTGKLAALTPAAAKVLVALCSYADRSYLCFPSATTLATAAGITSRAVFTATKELESAGIVTRKAGGGRGRATTYQINSEGSFTVLQKKLCSAASETMKLDAGNYEVQLHTNRQNRQNRPFASKAKAGKTPEQALREKVRKQLSGANNEQR